jgi:hypothetical protein
VVTVGDSCEADYLVLVICGRCETKRQMHPYRLIAAKKEIALAPLGKPMPGFFCKTCRSSVSATVVCTHERPGR